MFQEKNATKTEFDLFKVDPDFPILITLFKHNETSDTYLFENIREAMNYCEVNKFTPDEVIVLIDEEKIQVTFEFNQLIKI